MANTKDELHSFIWPHSEALTIQFVSEPMNWVECLQRASRHFPVKCDAIRQTPSSSSSEPSKIEIDSVCGVWTVLVFYPDFGLAPRPMPSQWPKPILYLYGWSKMETCVLCSSPLTTPPNTLTAMYKVKLLKLFDILLWVFFSTFANRESGDCGGGGQFNNLLVLVLLLFSLGLHSAIWP